MNKKEVKGAKRTRTVEGRRKEKRNGEENTADQNKKRSENCKEE